MVNVIMDKYPRFEEGVTLHFYFFWPQEYTGSVEIVVPFFVCGGCYIKEVSETYQRLSWKKEKKRKSWHWKIENLCHIIFSLTEQQIGKLSRSMWRRGTHTGGLQKLDVVCSTWIMANLFLGVGELYCRLEILRIFEQSFYVIDSDKL